MNERVSAAAEAIWRNSRKTVLHEEHYRDAKSALAAADAVMFSEEARIRAWRAVILLDFEGEASPAKVVSAVLAALKGAGNE